MKNNLTLLLLLLCSTSIAMAMSKKANNKYCQRRPQKKQWVSTTEKKLDEIVTSKPKNLSDKQNQQTQKSADSNTALLAETILNTQQNTKIKASRIDKVSNIKKQPSLKVSFNVSNKIKLFGFVLPFFKKDLEHYYFNPLQETDNTFEYYSEVYIPAHQKENKNIKDNRGFNGMAARLEKNAQLKISWHDRCINKINYRKTILKNLLKDKKQRLKEQSGRPFTV